MGNKLSISDEEIEELVLKAAQAKEDCSITSLVKEANKHRNEWFEGVHKCRQDESLFAVMERIVKAEVHRLVVVNDDNKVVGVISLSDILNYLVLRPGGKILINVFPLYVCQCACLNCADI